MLIITYVFDFKFILWFRSSSYAMFLISNLFCVLDLPRNHPESYHFYMWNNFFKHIDIDPENVHVLDGNASDLVAECDNYEKKIEDAGGIELFIGGHNLEII